MAADEIHVDDIGTQFIVTINQNCTDPFTDLVNATVKQFIFQKPNGNKITKDVVFYTSGVDGILSYVTQSGDLDIAGNWKLQAYIVIGPSGWRTDIYSFPVHRNL
jgi:hypothetical protein